jgi:hypothetical protein
MSSSLRNPVGPQPPAVYWRRRLLLALGALAVLIVIILIIVRPGAGAPESAQTSPPATPEASESPAPTVGDAEACDPAVVLLTPVTDAETYPAEATPQISMTIMNSGSEPCSFDVGTAEQEYVITSGADRIWSSRDCQTDAVADVRVLEPGQELATTAFPWDRTRSSTDTCSTQRPPVTAGGASYHLQVFVGDAESEDTKQFILE